MSYYNFKPETTTKVLALIVFALFITAYFPDSCHQMDGNRGLQKNYLTLHDNCPDNRVTSL